MHTLVLCLDGFDLDLAAPLLAEGRLPTLARFLPDARNLPAARFRSKGPVDPWLSWMTGLCGVDALTLGVTGQTELDGAGRLRSTPPSRRKTAAIYEVAAAAGRAVACVNLPFRAALANSQTLAVTDDFFAASSRGDLIAEDSVIGADPADLIPLCVRNRAIGTGHLRHIAPALLDLDNTDIRRLLICRLLSHALTVHDVATAIVGAALADEMPNGLLACVRYELVAAFHDSFIDYTAPAAPYISKEDEKKFSGLLPSIFELQDHFIARLIALMPPETCVVAASEHGYLTRSRRGVEFGSPIRELTFPARREPYIELPDRENVLLDLDLHRPAIAEEYHTTNAWIVANPVNVESPRTEASDSTPDLPMTALYDLIATSAGISGERHSLEGDRDDDSQARELVLDDRLELGLTRLDMATNERREAHLDKTLEILAVHAEASENYDAAIKFLHAKLTRSFHPAAGLKLVETLLHAGRGVEATALATTLSSRMPHMVRAHLARAATHLAAGDRRAAARALAEAQARAAPDDEAAERFAARFELSPVAKISVEEIEPAMHLWLVGSPGWRVDWAERFAGELTSINADDECLRRLAPVMEKLRVAPSPPTEANNTDFDIRRRSRLASSEHGDGEEARRRARVEEWVHNGRTARTSWHRLPRLLHRMIAPARAPEAGRWRTNDVAIIGHWLDGKLTADAPHPPPAAVAVHIARMVDGAEAEVSAKCHPALLAAAFASDLLCVHPFADGNGRVARLMAIEILRRGGLCATRYLNLDRRYDRCRVLADSTFPLAYRGHPIELPSFWVRFIADAYRDAAHRAERLAVAFP